MLWLCNGLAVMYTILSYLTDKVVWSWASFKCRKGCRKVNIELVQDFNVMNIPAKPQDDAVSFSNFFRSYLIHKFLPAYPGYDNIPPAVCDTDLLGY